MSNTPCKNCPDRQLHCHSTCERYLLFQEKQAKIRQWRHFDSEAGRPSHTFEKNFKRKVLGR